MTDKRPLPMVALTADGISPLTAYDAERMCELAHGQRFELKAESKRSNPHLRLYWQALANAVKATQKWPTSEHLHSVLKIDCGYVDRVVGLDGHLYDFPDSIAFSKMNQEEFKTYFDTAIAKLSEYVGFDVLEVV